jgi:alkanesulfonate monooxygenase SsuD/methylene tetrahydromethanopterin reductase-like flavin-dependent oxidoreductase (luciferase family)
MRYGISLPPFGPFADPRALADLAGTAEAAGWDGFFVWDHVVFDPTFHPVGDPWIGLAAVATRTERMTLGTMVTPLARRRPWQVARESVALDLLSGGRFVLGIGLGGREPWDFDWFGEEPDLRTRAAALDEALEIITGLWTGEPFAYAGEHFRIEQRVTFRPRPSAQPRIPIWVGGFWPNRAPLRRAARWDGMAIIKWGETMSPAELAEAQEVVDTHRTASGPFDVVASGPTGEDPTADRASLAEYEAVGTTWWLEDVSPWRFGADVEAAWRPADTEAMVRRVEAGPPG